MNQKDVNTAVNIARGVKNLCLNRVTNHMVRRSLATVSQSRIDDQSLAKSPCRAIGNHIVQNHALTEKSLNAEHIVQNQTIAKKHAAHHRQHEALNLLCDLRK